MPTRSAPLVALTLGLLASGLLAAADAPAAGTPAAGTPAAITADGSHVLTLQDHRFTPATLNLPPDTRIKLLVQNRDDTAAEFESTDLNREKVVNGKKEITVFIGPLSAGTYAFYDEFHKDTATGTIIVK